AESCGVGRHDPQTLRLGRELVDAAASRNLPGLLLFSLSGTRPEYARAIPRSSEFRAHRDVLRASRPERIRSQLRHDAARSLRADGAAGDGASETFDLSAHRRFGAGSAGG